MKKPKRLKKPQLPAAVKRSFVRKKTDEQKVSDALSNVPRITNETVGEHREEVLSSARKYIYPLQHSKHRVVRISLALLALVIISFFAITGLALYKFQSTSTFSYDVTRIIPFPVAKAGHTWVSYESYLFELRRNMHYYQTQQQTNFSTKDGKAQLKRLKQQAMNQVVQDAYIKQLANQSGVSVSDQAVSNQLTLVRTQNRLGSNDRVFREVLNEFWGWRETDFKRELKQQLLQQAVVARLDTGTAKLASDTLTQLKGGADFAALAAQLSDDPLTKGSGGQYPAPVIPGTREIPPATTAALFKLKPGQLSGVINSGYSLDIAKVIDTTGSSLHAAHIQFNLKDITTYVKPLQAKQPGHQYIKF
ncbi:hypothetical protein COY17_03070 [Candidatus Saccharibacteria bacterium CG_4_10_14_0_2_um_filter_52_9]|nr:MAG: hypothetical protein COY17_03070 [Candidatus Saccharibacteria bacterium CG_4_10_14_0_2_um_filter_52_9]